MTKQNCLVDDKGRPFPIVSTNQNQLNYTTGPRRLAQEKKAGWQLHKKTVEAEQVTRKLRNLRDLGVGTNHIESKESKLRGELKGVDVGRRVKSIIESMNMKISDASQIADEVRGRRDSWRKEIEEDEVFETGKVEKMIRNLKVKSASYREKVKKKNQKSVTHLVEKWKGKEVPKTGKIPEMVEYMGRSVMSEVDDTGGDNPTKQKEGGGHNPPPRK